jgi:hypothetical protein
MAEPIPSPKLTDKKTEIKESIKIEKVEKFEKPEFKEHKDLKNEKLEKNEAKEHKDAKHEKAEKNEAKEHKDAKHEKLEKNELKEHKDAKHEKLEKNEAKELAKPEFPEKQIPKEKDGKEIFEGPQPTPGDPIEQRLAALEQSVANLQHFITSAQRPDLSRGALSEEPDRPSPQS